MIALYLGGASTLRGFKFRDVGPKDDQGNAVGGNTLARCTIEYTIPIIERVRFAVFYDGGFVNPGSWSFSPEKVQVPGNTKGNSPEGSIRISVSECVSTCQSGHCGLITVSRLRKTASAARAGNSSLVSATNFERKLYRPVSSPIGFPRLVISSSIL